jgi:hypothetical protein
VPRMDYYLRPFRLYPEPRILPRRRSRALRLPRGRPPPRQRTPSRQNRRAPPPQLAQGRELLRLKEPGNAVPTCIR